MSFTDKQENTSATAGCFHLLNKKKKNNNMKIEKHKSVQVTVWIPEPSSLGHQLIRVQDVVGVTCDLRSRPLSGENRAAAAEPCPSDQVFKLLKYTGNYTCEGRLGLRVLKLRRWMNCVRVKDKMHTLKYWMKSSARLVPRDKNRL